MNQDSMLLWIESITSRMDQHTFQTFFHRSVPTTLVAK
jgi:hypothetical protein